MQPRWFAVGGVVRAIFEQVAPDTGGLLLERATIQPDIDSVPALKCEGPIQPPARGIEKTIKGQRCRVDLRRYLADFALPVPLLPASGGPPEPTRIEPQEQVLTAARWPPRRVHRQ